MPFYHTLKNYRPHETYPDKHVYSNKADWIARRLLTLRHDLNHKIVRDRQPNSLIIGSWNIRAFDGGIPRLDESFHYIAEIIATFDICAVQELREDLRPLRRLMKLLGPNWDYFVTDTSTHEGGNNERMAFIYNVNKVFFRNLIGEIVIGSTTLSTGRQIARSPFFAAFQADWFRFTLCSTHIVFGRDISLRSEEIKAITDILLKRAEKEDQVFVFLGDMNIDSPEGENMQALLNSGMEVPDFPAVNMKGNKFYDQIAFTTKGASTRKTRLLRHGIFDWRYAVFGPQPDAPLDTSDSGSIDRPTHEENLAHYEPIVAWNRQDNPKNKDKTEPYENFSKSYNMWMTFEMSDHLPIWVELETDYSEDYLKRFVKT